MSSRLALPVIALFLLAIASWVILRDAPSDSPEPGISDNRSANDSSTPVASGANGAMKPEQANDKLARTDVMTSPVDSDGPPTLEANGAIASFAGRVVDENGQPIENVQIFAMAMLDWAASWDASRNVLPKDWTAATDSDGYFSLPEAPSDRLRFLLEFRHPDFATFELFNQPAHPGRTRELGNLTMDVGFSLSGVVTDPNGQAVANAEVVPYRGDGPRGFDPREVGKRPLLDAVITDERGHFTLHTLPTQPVRLKARAPGYFEAWSQTANGSSGAQLEGLKIQLSEATSVFGVILDSSRNPITGAQIEIRDNRWAAGASESPFLATTESQTDGKFELILPSGTTRISVTVGAAGFYVFHKRLDEAAQQALIEVVMTPMPPLQGVVVDEAGAAVADATVVLLPTRGNFIDPPNTPPNASTSSEADGTFTLMPNLKSSWGGRFTVYAWTPEHALGQSPLLRIRESNNSLTPDLRIVLQRGFSASGRILQPDGSIQANARVYLRKLRKPRRQRLPNINESQRGGDIVQRTSSAADGSFSFSNLDGGDYRIEAYHPGFSPIESEDFGLVDIDFQADLRLVESCGISGDVVGDLGAFRQLRVTATSPGLDRLEAFVDGHGRFEFEEMMPANWNLILTDASDLGGNPSFTFGSTEPLARADGIEVLPGQTTPLTMNLDIAGLGSVSGVVRINGETQPNYGVYVVPQLSPGSDQGGVGRRAIMRQMRSVATDYQGRFTLSGLQPNDYWILLVQPGGWPDLKFSQGNSAPEAMQRGTITVRESAVTEFTFDVYLGGLQVTIANRAEGKSTSMRLVPSPTDGRTAKSARLNRNGYTFTDIPTGSYNLLVRVGGAWQSYPVSVPSLSATTVNVVLPTAANRNQDSKKKR